MKGFEFEHEGRGYVCSIGSPVGSSKESWWWFQVSGDANKYAPFRVTKGETKESVQTRVVEYYRALQERRAMPPEARQAWWQRKRESQAAATTTTPEAKETEE